VDRVIELLYAAEDERDEWKARAEKAELWIKTFLDATCLGDNIESVDPTEAAGIVNLWGFWSDRVEKMEATIARMNPVYEAAVQCKNDCEVSFDPDVLPCRSCGGLRACAAVEATKDEKMHRKP